MLNKGLVVYHGATGCAAHAVPCKQPYGSIVGIWYPNSFNRLQK